MKTTVGVLCARVRVEEKQLLAALAGAGLVAEPRFPAAAPLPVPPPSPTWPGSVGETGPDVLIDRCRDRAVASVLLRMRRAQGGRAVDAGLAATGDRLAVAAALAAAGLPRPETRLAPSSEAALAAIGDLGYPATILSLAQGSKPVALFDVDTAEAVLEHREVLGSARELPALVQAGVAAPGTLAAIIVVDGRATAVSGRTADLPIEASRLAEAAAGVLGAALVGIDLVLGGDRWLVWDVQAVPDFRDAHPLVEGGVATALAALLVGPTPQQYLPAVETVVIAEKEWLPRGRKEARDGALLLA